MKKIVYKRLDELKPYENNPRNNVEAVEKVAASIREFGFNVPILVKPDMTIIAGHTRLEAAKLLKKKKVPCIVVDDLPDELVDQFRIIDNKVAELSSWDFEKLMVEMGKIREIDMDAFGFGDFEEAASVGSRTTKDQNLEGKELALDDFEDDQFEIECPHCGFRWNEQ